MDLEPNGDPPIPIAALWTPPATLDVTFDQPLVPAVLDNLNWELRQDNNRYTAVAASIMPPAPNPTVRVLVGVGLFEPGDDFVSYAPPPFDVISAVNGLPAAAFVFPEPA